MNASSAAAGDAGTHDRQCHHHECPCPGVAVQQRGVFQIRGEVLEVGPQEIHTTSGIVTSCSTQIMPTLASNRADLVVDDEQRH